MLIAQNAEPAAAAQELSRLSESFAALKQLHACAATLPAHVFVDALVAETLVYGAHLGVSEERREQVRDRFPIREMTEHNDCRPISVPVCDRDRLVVDLDTFAHRVERHAGHLDSAKQIRPEVLEMTADEPSRFARRFLVGKGDLDIAPREPAIVRQERPDQEPGDAPDVKEHAQREQANYSGDDAVQDVDAELNHARTQRSGRRARERKFACQTVQSI
jgi:hypothetical protein